MPEQNALDKRLVIETVKNWLAQAHNWLLILDDVLSFSLVKTFLPETWHGQILLTTPSLSGENAVFRVPVEPMTPQEGGELLLKLHALKTYAPPEDDASEEERDLAEEIARETQGLPLALQQAGAYLQAAGYSISGYLSLYRRERSWQQKQHGNLFADHLHPVALTFNNALGDIEKWYPAGADMLRVCAFLHPHAIPEELLFRGASCLGPHLQSLAKDYTKLREIITEMRDYGLLHRDSAEQTVSIHRFVQGLLKAEMDSTAYRDWSIKVILALNKTFPKRGAVSWKKCQRWLPHVLSSADLIDALQITVPEAVQLLYRAGDYASVCGLYRERETLLRQAHTLSEKIHGAQHADTVQIAKSLVELAEKRQ